MAHLDPAEVRAYLSRPWGEVAEEKRRYWAERHAGEGPLASFLASIELREHLCRIQPGWPGEAYLAADLAHHVELKRLLTRAADALAAR